MKDIGVQGPSTPGNGYAGPVDFIAPWTDPPEGVVDITGAEPVIRTGAAMSAFTASSREWAEALADARAEIAELKEEIRQLRESSGATTGPAMGPKSPA